MTEGSLSRRYGKALFELARDEKREEAVGQEIEQFLTAYQGSALQSVLNNPGFELEQRKRILEQVARSIQLSPLALHFLSLLFDRDRLPYLQGISSHYRRLLNESRGRVEAKLGRRDALSNPAPWSSCVTRSKAYPERMFCSSSRPGPSSSAAYWLSWKERSTTAACKRSSIR